jgi:hypothetical protein
MGGKTVFNGRPVSMSNGNTSGAEDIQKQAAMDAELYGMRESVSGVFWIRKRVVLLISKGL